MVPKEREWFAAVCYLDVINEDTLRVLLPEEEVPLVQDWFEREASIRDPAARSFRMRPLVREKALRYLETRSPSRHREMLRKAKGGGEDAPFPPESQASFTPQCPGSGAERSA